MLIVALVVDQIDLFVLGDPFSASRFDRAIEVSSVLTQFITFSI